MARIIKIDGTIELMTPKVKHLSLTELQEAVGGYIETVAVSDGMILIVNEDGLHLNLQINRAASEMASRMIVGDAVLVNELELEQ